MGERRRRFTWEFKVEAVRLVHESGKPQAQVARELGIRPDVLRDWRRQVEAHGRGDASGATGAPGGVEEENPRLRRENEVLHQERDFLKKRGKSTSSRNLLSDTPCLLVCSLHAISGQDGRRDR